MTLLTAKTASLARNSSTVASKSFSSALWVTMTRRAPLAPPRMSVPRKLAAEAQAVRDYFRIEDEAGERFWIFRAGDGEDAATGSHRWFLHGIFG